jgi:hypothetical protein
VTSTPWRLLLPVLLAIGLLAGPSSRSQPAAAVDVQAARACWAFDGFYNGLPLPGERAVHTPSAQDVRDAVAPLRGTKRAALGAHLRAAVDAGQTGRVPQDQTLLAPIDPECNQLPLAAKLAGGWKPGF